MRRALLASALAVMALPAMAQPARMSSPVAVMALGCMADCLSGASLRHGAAADAQRMCQARCAAAARFDTQSSALRGRRGAPLHLAAAAMPAPLAVPPGAPHSVIYAGRSPSPGFGLVAGERDRLAAFRIAEEQCRATGTACRMLMEAPAACGAVAQALRRSPHALVMTSDPSTYIVTVTAGGFGATQAAAEAQAMAECRGRDQAAQCRVMAARCGARS